jgi:hypothetical protein
VLVGRQALLKHKKRGGLKRFDSGDYFLEQEQYRAGVAGGMGILLGRAMDRSKHKKRGGLKRFDSGDYFLEQEQQKQQAHQSRGGQRGSCCASSDSLSPVVGSVVGPRTSSCVKTAGYDLITNTNTHVHLRQEQQQGKVTESTHDQRVRRARTVERYGNYRQMIDCVLSV